MSTSRHKIDATRSGTFNGVDYDLEYEITFTYLPGAPDTFDEPGYGPELDFVAISPGTGDHGGYGPEIDFIAITPDAGDHGGFTDLAQRHLEEWAADWLDEHHAECCDLAEAERATDPDYARDLKIEDRERDR